MEENRPRLDQSQRFRSSESSERRDKNITDIKFPPLNLSQPFSSLSTSNISTSTPAFSTSSSSTQAQLLQSTSSIGTTLSEPQPHIPVSNPCFPPPIMFSSCE
ncbi:hypothetical protein TNCV_2546991 [Trichonephila clavipes]|nr:hypothetical protein TNCV_2546991 [Trichonephila clavipes]